MKWYDLMLVLHYPSGYCFSNLAYLEKKAFCFAQWNFIEHYSEEFYALMEMPINN